MTQVTVKYEELAKPCLCWPAGDIYGKHGRDSGVNWITEQIATNPNSMGCEYDNFNGGAASDQEEAASVGIMFLGGVRLYSTLIARSGVHPKGFYLGDLQIWECKLGG